MDSYDKRLKDKLMGLKEKNDQGIYSTIKIMCDFSDENLYGIYDKYMNYISGYNNVIKNAEKLIEYRLKEGKWPGRNIQHDNINIGTFLDRFKYKFLKPIKMGKEPKLYVTEKTQLIKMLKDAELYEEIIKLVNIEEKTIKKTPIEKMEITIEYRLKNNKWPKQKEKYKNINIGNFWNTFIHRFLKPIKMGKEPELYVTEKPQLIKMLKDAELYIEALELVNIEEKITPIKRMSITMEYRLKKDKWPSSKEKYRDINIGQFWNTFIQRFLKPIKMGKEPTGYTTEKNELIKMLKNVNLYEEVLDLVNIEEKKAPIKRMAITIEYRLKNNKWPSSREKYKDLNIGGFWADLKRNFLKQIKPNTEIIQDRKNPIDKNVKRS